MTRGVSITFRPLAESDLVMLHGWQTQPHMRDYYQPDPISQQELNERYIPRITGEHKTFCHLAARDGEQFGYIQCYRNMDYPEYAAQIKLTEGVSIDLFIGVPELLGKGLGREMLKGYVERVVFTLYPDETKCYIWHNVLNVSAINCSRAVGFQFVREVPENGVMGALLLWERKA